MRAVPLLLLLAATPLHAQWSTSLAVHRSASTGHSRDGIGTELRPHGPITAALALAMRRGAWRVRFAARYSEAGLAVWSDRAALITPKAMRAWGTTVEADRRVAGDDDTQPTLRVGVGVELARWTFNEAADDDRWRPAALGALEGSVRLGRRWRMLARGEVAIGPSLFRADELPEGYTLRRAVRHGIGFGVERTL